MLVSYSICLATWPSIADFSVIISRTASKDAMRFENMKAFELSISFFYKRNRQKIYLMKGMYRVYKS